MGVEYRNGHSYYYKKERCGDRVVSRYIGPAGGVLPQLMADFADARRGRPGLASASIAAGQAEADSLHVEAGRVAAGARELARLALEAIGFHQHARGDWRRRRMKRPGVDIYAPGPTQFPPPGPEQEAFQDRARAGDESTRPAIRNFFLRFPEQATQGDVAANVENRLIRMHAPGDVIMQEAIRAKLAAVREDLAGPEPTPIERMLANRAAFLWLAAHAAEADALKAEGPGTARADRRCVTAHNRYVSTLKALATVRKLALPEFRGTINVDQRTQTVKVVQLEQPQIEDAGQAESKPRASPASGRGGTKGA